MKNSILTIVFLLPLLATVSCTKSIAIPIIETTSDTMGASVNDKAMYELHFSFANNSANSTVSGLNLYAYNDSGGISINLLDYHGVGYYSFTGADGASYTAIHPGLSGTFIARSGGVNVTKAASSYIQGTFSFVAGSYNISNGIFNIVQ